MKGLMINTGGHPSQSCHGQRDVNSRLHKLLSFSHYLVGKSVPAVLFHRPFQEDTNLGFTIVCADWKRSCCHCHLKRDGSNTRGGCFLSPAEWTGKTWFYHIRRTVILSKLFSPDKSESVLDIKARSFDTSCIVKSYFCIDIEIYRSVPSHFYDRARTFQYHLMFAPTEIIADVSHHTLFFDAEYSIQEDPK